MSSKPIDSTTKILRKIQSDLAQFRREVIERFDAVDGRFDKLEELIAGAAATAMEARGMAERVKERVRRLEDHRKT
jgi:archaellum component FlaC